MSAAPDAQRSVGVAVSDDRVLIADGLRALLDATSGLHVVPVGSPDAEFTVVGESSAPVSPTSTAVRLDTIRTMAELVDFLGGRPQAVAEARDADRNVLTPRERTVMHAVSQGRSAKSIADHLGISPRTVERHRTSAMTKLGAQNLAVAVARSTRGLRDAG